MSSGGSGKAEEEKDDDVVLDLAEQQQRLDSMPADELRRVAALAIKEYLREKVRGDALDEECDILATEVDRLQSELNIIRETHVPRRPPKDVSKEFASSDGSNLAAPIVFVEGDSKYPKTIVKRFGNACSEKNVVCVGVLPSSVLHPQSTISLLSSERSANTFLIICGGADSFISFYLCDIDGNNSSNDSSSSDETPIFRISMPSAVLSIDTCGTLVAASSMDGSHVILDLSREVVGDSEKFVVSREKNHSKYLVRTRWSDDGNLLCTLSHDKSLVIYKKNSNLENLTFTFEKVQKLNFLTTPEDAIFVPNSSSCSSSSNSSSELSSISSVELAVAIRDSHSLLYVSCDADKEEPGSFKVTQRAVSMNERDWDSHVSFNALCLTLSPDKKYLLVSTDKHMHILFMLGTNVRVRLFNDHDCGDYGKPRVSFDPTGAYIYCNSDNSKDMFIYSLASGKLVQKLSGHSGQVKDMVIGSSPNSRVLVSGSFDKSVIVWK